MIPKYDVFILQIESFTVCPHGMTEEGNKRPLIANICADNIEPSLVLYTYSDSDWLRLR